MMKTAISLALVAFAAAECPNACSGHGKCATKDMCECYANYQGNDCSERTCYFGIAHVDTPKGDLNADGMVSGPLTTVITGSEVYPWGTTEQYPNADANEGHFYMECSNKGLCDRKSGECDCFDGYEGTACVRASCPNECSGHGTCESIKELAELKTYDTNAGDVPTTTPVGTTASGTTYGHHDFDLAIEESYAYDLWDADKTMGCKCDPVYYGADCSLKKCKYGVDPLFYDDFDGVIHQTTVVHLGSKGTNAADITGTFNIAFYDVFGEKYTTKPINAKQSTVTSGKVAEAFESLPNGVISRTNGDTTRTATPAVKVSMQHNDGTLTNEGTLGAGAVPNGVGYGTMGAHGPEFTVTFSTNPGILKTIEVDTQQITNKGVTDYWVANMRQGQFSSRYSHSVGTVNTLLYGSKYLYTNEDYHTKGVITGAGNTLVKVNGQEFLAQHATADFADLKRMTLNEPFLGTSIIPVLTDTGAVATSIDSTANSMNLGIKASTVTTANTDSLATHAMLYVAGHPVTSKATPTGDLSTVTTLTIENTEALIHFEAGATTTEEKIYRRTEDPDNQNFYITPGDTGKVATDGFCTTRGSADVYPCQLNMGTASRSIAAADGDYVASIASATGAVTTAGTDVTGVTSPGAGEAFWVGGFGPYRAVSTASGVITPEITNIKPANKVSDFFPADGVAASMPIYKAKSTTDTIEAGKTMMLMNGRRYKVAATNHNVNGLGNNYFGTGVAAITLTEAYSGQHFLQMCKSCVASLTDGAVVVKHANGVAGGAVGSAGGYQFDLLKGDAVLFDATAGDFNSVGYVTAPFNGGLTQATQTAINTANADADAATALAALRSSAGPYNTFTVTDRLGGNLAAINSAVTDQSVYKMTSQNGFKPVLVTESSTGATYQYVSQCSNRGSCDGSTGLCTCFKGYTNDNCDTQNMLAG